MCTCTMSWSARRATSSRTSAGAIEVDSHMPQEPARVMRTPSASRSSTCSRLLLAHSTSTSRPWRTKPVLRSRATASMPPWSGG
nr:hypothetical protein [Rubrivivax gelatinosus]